MLYYFIVKEFLEKIIFEILKDIENIKTDFIPWKTIDKKNNEFSFRIIKIKISKDKFLLILF